jgi:hypothetical protein
MGSRLPHLLDGARPGVADRLAGMTELADTLRAAERQAGSANTAEQRDRCVDLLRLADGTLSLPSGISRDEAAATVRQAQDAGTAAALLPDSDSLAAFANPSPAAVTLAEALFGSWAGRKMSLVMQMPPLTCFAA